MGRERVHIRKVCRAYVALDWTTRAASKSTYIENNIELLSVSIVIGRCKLRMIHFKTI